MTSINLRFGDRCVRVACDSRRAVRKLRAALADHVDPIDEGPLGFVLTAPAGFQRHHQLVDRSGFVLSAGRGLDAGVNALASHLTAFVPPLPGTVRVRARALMRRDRAVVCLYPLLFVPSLDERELDRVGCELIDRLAVDVDVATGEIVNPPIPWPGLDGRHPGPGHAGPGGRLVVTAVIGPAVPGSPPPSRAAAVAKLAAGALAGRPEDVVDASIRLVKGAELRAALLGSTPLSDLVDGLRPS